MHKKFKYMCVSINFFTGQVCEFYGGTGNKTTTLDELGAEGWEIIGSEYDGKKNANGGALESASMWIAKKEV